MASMRSASLTIPVLLSANLVLACAGLVYGQSAAGQSPTDQSSADQSSQSAQTGNSSQLQEVTVTATKLDVSQADLPQASEVITNVDISDQAQTSVTDVLREEPGIQFQVGGAPGQFIYPRLRGFSDSTLYVFDGITMNTGGSGDVGYLLGQLDPSMVQSIQVLRGPHATTYGANTTSGVLDFTTLQGDHEEQDVSIEGGSLDWRKARFGVEDKTALGDGTWTYSLNGSWVDSGGMWPYEFTKNGTLVGRTTYQTGNIQFGGSFYLTDNDFQSAALVEPVDEAVPAPFYFAAQIPDPSNASTTKAGIVSLWFEQQLTTHLSQKLTVGGAGQDYDVADNPLPNGNLLGTYISPYNGWEDPSTYTTYPAGAVVPFYQVPYTYHTTNNNDEADYNLRYRTDMVSALVGGTFLGQNYDETYDGTGTKESQDTRSLYGNASLNLFDNRFHPELGARLDSYSEWKTKATYSVGAAYDLVRGLAVYANYGTSFTQPTLDELYDPIYGNKAVTPENADTVEAGLRGQLDNALTWAVTLWHSYVNNVITFDSAIPNPRILSGPPFGEYANLYAEKSQGVEAEMTYKITPHLVFNANYTRTDAYSTNPYTGSGWFLQIENARNMGNAGLTYTVAKFDVGTNFYLTDHRLDYSGFYWAPGYGRLDFFGRYHVTGHFDLYGRVQDATNADIIEILGYRNPKLYVVAGANYRFY